MVLWIPYQNSDALCLCILLAFSKHLRRRLVYDFKITNSFLSAQFDFTLKSTRKHFSRSYHLENIYPNRPLPISSFQTHNTQPRQYYLSTSFSLHSYLCPTSFSHRKAQTKKNNKRGHKWQPPSCTSVWVWVLRASVCAEHFALRVATPTYGDSLCGCCYWLWLPFISSWKCER